MGERWRCRGGDPGKLMCNKAGAAAPASCHGGHGVRTGGPAGRPVPVSALPACLPTQDKGAYNLRGDSPSAAGYGEAFEICHQVTQGVQLPWPHKTSPSPAQPGAPPVRTLLVKELAPLGILPRGGLGLDQLQDERSPGDDVGAPRQEITSHLAVQGMAAAPP